MLVFAKKPRGVLDIRADTGIIYRIYGKECGQEPTNLPFQVYNSCKDGLVDCTYREGILSKLFGKPFPEIAFTYHEIRWLPESTIDNIGPLMVSKYDKTWSHKKKVDQIKIALQNVSPTC